MMPMSSTCEAVAAEAFGMSPPNDGDGCRGASPAAVSPPSLARLFAVRALGVDVVDRCKRRVTAVRPDRVTDRVPAAGQPVEDGEHACYLVALVPDPVDRF